MPEFIAITVDGEKLTVPAGTSVASAILNSGRTLLRQSVHGEPRSALCGIGVCFECRVTIDETPHVRGCMTPCEEGMEIRTK